MTPNQDSLFRSVLGGGADFVMLGLILIVKKQKLNVYWPNLEPFNTWNNIVYE